MYVSKARNVISRHHKYGWVLTLFAVVIVFGVYFRQDAINAASATFAQTNWATGVTANTATHSSNQSGWTEYSEVADLEATSTVMLTPVNYYFRDDIATSTTSLVVGTGGTFSAGTFSNTSIVHEPGSGSSISLARTATSRPSISAGSSVYLVKSDGTVWSWGYNMYNALGYTPVDNNTLAGQVQGVGGVGYLTDVVQTAMAGQYQTGYALKSDGTVYGWGYNADGRVGDGTTTHRSTPVQVVGPGGSGYLEDVVALAGSQRNGYALKSDGTVWSWGGDIYGSLGRLGGGLYPGQVEVAGGGGYLTDVVAIAGGGAGYNGYALKSDGTVWSWGDDTQGQRGDGVASVGDHGVAYPVLVSGTETPLSDIVGISSFAFTAYALKRDGTVWGWGMHSDSVGQLGGAAGVSSATAAVQIDGLTAIQKISSGSNTGYALRYDGYLYAWGEGTSGQLGNGATSNSPTPVQVNPGSFYNTVVDFSGGNSNAAAVLTDGSVYTWGFGSWGQLGNNTTTAAQSAPVQALNQPVLGYFTAATSSPYTKTVESEPLVTYAISSTGSVYAWGYNSHGQLGDGTTTNRTTPVAALLGSGFQSVEGSGSGTEYTGYALEVGAGYGYSWGSNMYGQLCNGTQDGSVHSTPATMTIPGAFFATIRASHVSAVYGITTDNNLFACGQNVFGVLGDNSTTNRSSFVQVHGVADSGYLTNITSVEPGGDVVYALKSDGTVYAWGQNAYGSFGDGTYVSSYTPVQVHGENDVGFLSNVVAIAAGGYTGYAIVDDGVNPTAVWSWGYGADGQLGNGTNTSTTTPVQVHGPGGVGFLTDVVAIDASDTNVYAIKSDGTLYSWGLNTYGMLGDGTTTNSNVPVQVIGPSGVGFLTDVVKVSGSGLNAHAVKTDGSMYGWGYNDYGVLGDGTTTSTSTPTQVRLLLAPVAVDAGSAAYPTTMPISGTFTSAVIDLGATTSVSTFTYGSISNSETLTLEVRAGNNPDTNDPSWTSWVTGILASGADISSLSGNRYFQYRANFTTDNASLSSILTEAVINYAPQYPTSGSLTSNVYNTEDQTNHISRVQWQGATTTTETIRFQIRTSSDNITWSDWCGYTDTGSTCVGTNYFTDSHNNATLPVEHPIRSGGNDQYFQYKMFMEGSGLATPVLTEVSVHYFTNEPPEFDTSFGSGSGITAIQESTGEVTITYKVRDTDTLSASTTPGFITPSFEYSTNGGTSWASIPDADLILNATSTKAVGEVGYTTHTTTWYATSTSASVDVANAQIRITANDNEAAHNTITATSESFTLDTTGPTVSALDAPIGGRTTTAAQITFTTDETAVGYVEYSTQALGDYSSISSPTASGTSHDITISGLPTDTTYVYRAYAVDANGNTGSAVLGGTFTVGTPSTLSFTDDGATSTTSTLVVTGGDFDLGTYSSTAVSGSDTGASIILEPVAGAYTPMIVGSTIGNSSYLLKDDGTVWAWGGNDNGQLGDGTNTESVVPVQVSGLTDVIQIAAVMRTAYALKSDGTVWAWGDNGSGNLGDGNTPTDALTPVQVSALSGITEIAAGGFVAYALKSDGTVYSWGVGTYGGIGDGTTTTQTTPIQIPSLTGVSSITAGAYNGYALKPDGTVYAWGFNPGGMVGDGTTTTRLSPVLATITGVTSLKGGGAHALALKADGTVYSWGYNVAGALGDGTTTNNPTPTQVPGLTGVSAIYPGGIHSMVIKTNGQVWGWGDNMNGDLGDGSTTPILSPTYLSALTNVSSIGASYLYTLLIKSDNTIYSMGLNDHGQLGDSTTTNSTTPVRSGGSLFTAGSASYAASGTFTSAVINLAQSAGFTILNYSATLNSQTISIDTRAGDTATPDGTWTAWQTGISSGGDISGLEGNQYFQYRANLSTSNSAATPSLNSLTVFYTQFAEDAPAPTPEPEVSTSAVTGSNAGTVTPEGTPRTPAPETTPSPITETQSSPAPVETPLPPSLTSLTPEEIATLPPFLQETVVEQQAEQAAAYAEDHPVETFFDGIFGSDKDSSRASSGENVPTFTSFITDTAVKGITTITSLPPIRATLDATTRVVEDPVGAVVTKVAATAGVVSGTAIAVTSLFLNPLALAELFLIPARLMGIILSALGIRKRTRRWGTVYDSVTKQPLDPAYVILKDKDGNEVGTGITDLDGRYGFLIGPGTYTIEANKTNYTFPSKKLAGKTRDVLYDDLYFGEELTLGKDGAVITKNIPLDPQGFDWNEFTKQDQKLMKFHGKRDTLFQSIATYTLFIGLPIAIAGYLVTPAPYNTIIVGVYALLFILRMFGLKPKAHGSLTDSEGAPLSYAIVRVHDVNQGGKEIFHRVADAQGRYYCLVQKGQYTITVEKKNPDESYSLVYTSPVIDAKKGVVNQNVRV